MVLADVLCAVNLAASVMVNGLCCYYQTNEENERRKEHQMAIQNAIRKELNLHRRQEMLAIRDDLIRAHDEAVACRYIDERRRKLMAQKANSMVLINKRNDRDQPLECDRVDSGAMDTKHPTSTANDCFWSTIAKLEIAPTLKNTQTRRALAVSRESLVKGDESQRNPSFMSKVSKKTSSLFDNSLEEYGNDFEEICIE